MSFLSLDKWIGKVAIVTGASAGIGAAIATQLVETGIIVAGFARRAEKVEETAKKLSDKKGKLHGVKVDITKEEDIIEGFKWVRENLGPVHILVNNAGVARFTSLSDGETDMWLEVLQTNVLGLSICTREAVRDMKKNNVDGHIIHINSVTGHTVPPFPGMNVYSASKHAVTALAETLRQEFNFDRVKIKITSISPGSVDTEISQVSGFPDQFMEFFKKRNQENLALRPDDVGNAVLYVLSTPPHVQIQELVIKPVNEPF